MSWVSESKKSGRGIFVGQVSASDALCDEHYRLTLSFESFPATRPGQFVQVQCRGLGEQADEKISQWAENAPPKFTQPELIGKEPLLRRPFSLAGRREQGGDVELDIIYRTVGIGTHWLGGVKIGDSLSILGPLGNGFEINESKSKAALIGGGVGIPPMIYLAGELAKQGKDAVAFNGVRTASLLPLKIDSAKVAADGKPGLSADEFSAVGVNAVITTDDGSLGYRGFIDVAFRSWLEKEKIDPQDLVVYSCGPELMMKAAGDCCIENEIECQLALERHMACGMGTCQSCIVKIREDSEQGWSYKLCCSDGPVFEAGSIIWH